MQAGLELYNGINAECDGTNLYHCLWQWRRQDFVPGGHRFGVVKRPKIINVYVLPPQACVRVIALGLCVIHIQ